MACSTSSVGQYSVIGDQSPFPPLGAGARRWPSRVNYWRKRDLTTDDGRLTTDPLGTGQARPQCLSSATSRRQKGSDPLFDGRVISDICPSRSSSPSTTTPRSSTPSSATSASTSAPTTAS